VWAGGGSRKTMMVVEKQNEDLKYSVSVVVGSMDPALKN
jgi:hypothetical protein